jgi:hypothetical protein
MLAREVLLQMHHCNDKLGRPPYWNARQLAWNALGLSASILLPSRYHLFLDAQWPPPFQDEDIIGRCRAIAY